MKTLRTIKWIDTVWEKYTTARSGWRLYWVKEDDEEIEKGEWKISSNSSGDYHSGCRMHWMSRLVGSDHVPHRSPVLPIDLHITWSGHQACFGSWYSVALPNFLLVHVNYSRVCHVVINATQKLLSMLAFSHLHLIMSFLRNDSGTE